MNTSDIGPTEALWLSYCEVKGKLEEAQAQLKDAQGEIRALRATEAGLRERVKELEEGLRLCVHTIELANWGEDFTARNARALLEKKE